GSTRILLREGIQQRTDQLVLDDGIVGVFHRTRDQRVLGNLQIHARLAGLLAQVGQLADREAPVLRGDQRARLGGDLGQFGNDFLLLGQIESHCTPPYFNSTGCDMHAGGTPVGTVWPGAGTPRGVRVVAVSRNPGGSAPSTQARPRGAGLSGPVCGGGDSLPVRASLPAPATRCPRLRSLTAIAPENRDNRPQNHPAGRAGDPPANQINARARGSPGRPARPAPSWS